MKKCFFAFLLSCSLLLSAQEKYPSLLWEINGENLDKPSYLYGTMHISGRLAFHLSDKFFHALMGADVIGLESNPQEWLSEMEKDPNISPMLNSRAFYKSFQLSSLEQSNLAREISMDHYIINAILYRSNKAQMDFEEDTYLDMFIYQAGSKYEKEIVSLEDYSESSKLVNDALSEEFTLSPIKAWLRDLLNEKSLESLMEDTYRDNDLDMLDSIQKAYYTERYLNHMLYIRNENIATRYDSILSEGKTIFAGIGAAHLPGKEGVIEILRKKGYTVNPIKGPWTDTGKRIKENIENKKVPKDFKTVFSSDGFIELATPNDLYEISVYGKNLYISPDITNGSNISVSRIKSYEFLRDNSQKSISLDNIEKMLFESIPGKIISKKGINIDGISGLDILNKTRSGDFQRHALFITPLECIIIKMSGKKDFVKKESHKLFDHIKFHHNADSWSVKKTLQGGFEILTPDFYCIDNNHPFTNRIESPLLLAHNKETDGNYFVIQKVLNDVYFLEMDTFELKRIQEQFFDKLDIDEYTIDFKKERGNLSAFGAAKLNNGKNINLKTLVDGAHYYHLGVVNDNQQNTNLFFDSFKLTEMAYDEGFKSFTDSSLFFRVNTSYKPLGQVSYNQKSRNSYTIDTRNRTLNSPSKQQVFVRYKKFNDYSQYENLDSLWSETKTSLKNESLFVLKEEKGLDKNELPYYDLLLTDTATSRVIQVKNILKAGVRYQLLTLTDSSKLGNDAFIKEVFNSFSPIDTLIGLSPLDSKTEMFFEHLYSSVDSLKKQALENYHLPLFQQKDIPKLIETIENYNFEDKNLNVKQHLIHQIAKLEVDNLTDLLDKWYMLFSDNASIQIDILKIWTSKKNKKSVTKVQELLNKDLPLPYNKHKLRQLYTNILDSAELAIHIYPEMMDFISIPEYQEYILSTVASLMDESILSKKHLKRYKKQLLSMAKVEIKRSRSQNLESGNSSQYTTSSADKINHFIRLLLPFYKDTDVQEFINSLDNVGLKTESIFALAGKAKLKYDYNRSLLEKYTRDYETRNIVYNTFSNLGIENKLPPKYTVLDSLSHSYVYNQLDQKENKLEFYKKELLSVDDNTFQFFFYKYTTVNYSGKDQTNLIYTIYLNEDKTVPFDYQRSYQPFMEDSDNELEDIVSRIKLQKHPRVVIGQNVNPYGGLF